MIFSYRDIKGGSSVLVIVIVKVLVPRISLEDFRVRLRGIKYLLIIVEEGYKRNRIDINIGK